MGTGRDYVVPLTVQTGTAAGEQGRDLPKVMKGRLPRVSDRSIPEVHQLGPVVLGNT